MTVRTWTLRIRGDERDAIRAADKVERRYKNLDINKSFGSKLSQLSSRFQDFGSRMAATGRRIAKGIGLAAIGGLAALGAGFVSTFRAARESWKITRQTAQVIKTMGAASWISASQVGAFAERLAMLTGIDDEVIQSGANLLLTFRNIRNEVGRGNDIFDRALTISNDMSVALGQDMKSSVIQLGKALNDPIKGITALRRVGVSFTQQQQDQIRALVESGQTMQAQKLILRELGAEFGGAAEATATPWDRLKVTLGNIQEGIGMLLLPVVDRAVHLFNNLFPKAVNTAKLAIAGLVGGFKTGRVDASGFLGFFQRIGVFARDVWPVLKRIGQVIGEVGSRVGEFFKRNPKVAFTVLATVIGGLLLGAVVAVGAALVAVISPFVLVVGAVAALAGAVVYAYDRWSWFRTAVDAVVAWFKGTALPAIQSFIDLVVAKFREFAGWVREIWPQIQEAIGHVIRVIGGIIAAFVVVATAAWNRFGSTILAHVRSTWNAIRGAIQGILNIVRGVIQVVLALINGDWGRAWQGILMILRGAWQLIGSIISAALASVRFVISAAWDAIRGHTRTVWEAVKSAVGGAIDWVWSKIIGKLNEIQARWSTTWEAMREMARGLWDGIRGVIRGGANAVISVINWFIRLINHLPGVNIGELKLIPGGGGGGSRAPGRGGDRRTRATGGFITNGPQYIVGEGNPAYPEAVIATDPRYRRRNLGYLAWAANKLGVPGYQFGGIVEGAGDIAGGAVDIAKDVAGGAIDIATAPIRVAGRVIKGTAEAAARWVRELSVAALGPVKDAAKRSIGAIPGIGWVGDFSKGVIDRFYNWAKGKAEENERGASGGGGVGGGVGVGGGGGAERWRGVGARVLGDLAMPAGWIGSLLRRMNQESGGNPTAVNRWDINWRRGTPSVGLMQVIGPTFRRWARPNARGPFMYGTSIDPYENIYASARYADARYDSAAAGWNRPGGYQAGGILGYQNGGRLREDVYGVGRSGQRYMMHRGEHIISKRDSGGPRTVVEIGELHVHADDAEGGRRAGKAFLDVLAERRILTDARIT